jgi:transposase
MGIPAIGPLTALTWTLEVGDVQRFSLIKKAIIYCGLCGAEKSSGCTVQRTPLSKQRNNHLQTTLIEAATMGPRYSLTRPSDAFCEGLPGAHGSFERNDVKFVSVTQSLDTRIR